MRSPNGWCIFYSLRQLKPFTGQIIIMTHVSKFRNAFNIDPNADLSLVEVAVDAIYGAENIGFDFLANLELNDQIDDFRKYALINLLNRVFKHAQAMLVAIATNSPASAEALARIVVEGSVNIMYLAAVGESGTLLQFFRSWLGEHDRKLSAWKQKVQGEEFAGRILPMIEARRQVVHTLESYLKKVESLCSADTSAICAEWPKSLFKRFEALGLETDYYESYHRLSGASHITGEDTVTWLLSLNMPIELRQQMELEAWVYSIMMSRVASSFFVQAVASCVIVHGRKNNEDLLECRSSLSKSIEQIASAAGVPIFKNEAAE